MQNQLPPEENLTLIVKNFLIKTKVAFNALFTKKAIFITGKDIDVFNISKPELSEIITKMYFDILHQKAKEELIQEIESENRAKLIQKQAKQGLFRKQVICMN